MTELRTDFVENGIVHRWTGHSDEPRRSGAYAVAGLFRVGHRCGDSVPERRRGVTPGSLAEGQ